MSTSILLKSSSGVQTVSIESKLMSDHRSLFITGEINADSAMDFFKQVMLLNLENDKEPIYTFCTGCAYSMGAVLFACGKERFMLPHSKLMLHEPLLGGKIGGNASSIKSISESLMETKGMMNKLLAFHTGKTEAEMDELTSYDHYFSAQEAVKIGLADGIMNFMEMMEGCA